MTTLHVSGKQKAAAKSRVVTHAEFERLRERIEDLEDALDILQSQTEGPTDDAWPSELVDRMIRGESRLRLWREHRGLTLAQLGKRTGIAKGYLSEVENKKKPGSAAALKKCAQALRIDLDDLV